MSGLPALKPQRSAWTRAQGQRVVRERAYWCELRIPGVCLGRGASFSHRKPASLGGGYEPSGGTRACGSGTTGCHGAIEGAPLAAEQFGWRVPYLNPAEVPAFVWTEMGQCWVFLTDTDPSFYDSEHALDAAVALGLPEVPEWTTTRKDHP